MFDDHLARWGLVPDGEPIATHSSRLLPVQRDGAPAILEIALCSEERCAGLLMLWWNGDGAARVLAYDGTAFLLERATGGASMSAMARDGHDDEASRIICAVAARLHAPPRRPPPELIPLSRLFEELGPAASRHGGLLADFAGTARALLAAPEDIAVPHGDLHHHNVLHFGHFGPRGWLAIDSKRLVGERTFDFANLLRNPEHGDPMRPGRLARQVRAIAEAAALDPRRLIRWTLAFAGLSAAWLIGDGETPTLDLAVAELAAAELARA